VSDLFHHVKTMFPRSVRINSALRVRTYLADHGITVHRFLEENRSIAHIVAGDQMIGIIHAGWMHSEPIYDTQWLIGSIDKLYLR